MAYKLIVIDNDEEKLAYVVGECATCHRGDNSLIIYKQAKNPNIRERHNNILYLYCVCCGVKYKTTLNKLLNNGEQEDGTN